MSKVIPEIETKYVAQAYDAIAMHFDKTRVKLWDKCQDFLQQLQPGSRIADIGCGSGSKMTFRNDCSYLGIDCSIEMVKICQQKGLDCHLGNLWNLSLDSDQFDVTLCVAVLHHLSTLTGRQQAMSELIRITKPGGLIYIQVWGDSAIQLPKSEGGSGAKIENIPGMTIQDKFVLWKTDFRYHNPQNPENQKRFYHFFSQGELEQLVDHTLVTVVESFIDHNNHGLILKKNDN